MCDWIQSAGSNVGSVNGDLLCGESAPFGNLYATAESEPISTAPNTVVRADAILNFPNQTGVWFGIHECGAAISPVNGGIPEHEWVINNSGAVRNNDVAPAFYSGVNTGDTITAVIITDNVGDSTLQFEINGVLQGTPFDLDSTIDYCVVGLASGDEAACVQCLSVLTSSAATPVIEVVENEVGEYCNETVDTLGVINIAPLAEETRCFEFNGDPDFAVGYGSCDLFPVPVGSVLNTWAIKADGSVVSENFVVSAGLGPLQVGDVVCMDAIDLGGNAFGVLFTVNGVEVPIASAPNGDNRNDGSTGHCWMGVVGAGLCLSPADNPDAQEFDCSRSGWSLPGTQV